MAVATAGGGIALSQLRFQQSQLRDQQEDLGRDAEDRRRAQASRIFVSVPSADDRGVSVQPSVKNASDFPIFEAKFWYIEPDGLYLMRPDPRDYRGTTLPGDESHGWRKSRLTKASDAQSSHSATRTTFTGSGWQAASLRSSRQAQNAKVSALRFRRFLQS